MTEKKEKMPSRAEKTIKTRLKIIEAAGGCFIAKGFHQSSMRDIANTAGVSLGNLYNHFESKADLIMGLAELEAAELSELIEFLEKDANCLQKIRKFTEIYYRAMQEPGNAALTAEIFAEAQRNEDIGEIFRVNRQTLVTALADALVAGQNEGDVDRSLFAVEMSELILDLIEGAALRTAVNGTHIPKKELKMLHMMIEKSLKAK